MSAVSSPTTESALSTTTATYSTVTTNAGESENTLAFTKNLPAREVHRRAQAARRLQGKAHHLLAHWMLEVDERKLHLELGYSSVYQYAELSLHLEGHTVAEYLRTARALKNFPLLSEAYQNGSLSASKLREITRVVEKDTERFWLEKALTHTTRQIERMVVFSPRQSRLKEVTMGEQQSPSINSNSLSALPARPTVGVQGQPIPPSFQGNFTTANPAHENKSENHTTQCVDDAPAILCCRDNLTTPQGHHDGDFHEEHSLANIPPRKYFEKIVLELSGEQAEIVHNAFKKARKESGLSGRASLVTYLARAFLDGVPERNVQQSKKPPYQVVLHHQSGITWTESEQGPIYVPDAVCEKALCDTEIIEVDNPSDYCRQIPSRVTPGGQTSTMSVKDKEMQNSRENTDSAERSVYSSGQSASGPLRELELDCINHGERVNWLFQFYRKRAREEKESETGQPFAQSKPTKSSTRTVPLSLRKKVLLRDGSRCQAPGCGRTRFVEIHHILPVGAGGDHTAANILVLCAGCHASVHEGTLTVEGEAPGRLRWQRMKGHS